ncbi:MAG: carbohydrate ABC transporter permease [Defluviitaleaceae bacterium]|nr:carbohydrate ABC transporter permease [Defluviitaleaceae bacterium]MCL2238922.1 carbohydrate ABC transporter permease [Defluviitaleaceae bacterium]
MKKLLFGNREKNGLLVSVVMYTLLISIGFIFLYPILHMFSISILTPQDLLDSSVRWIPRSLNFTNYRLAVITLDYFNTLWKNVQIALFPTLLQVVSTALAGYAFARYTFPLKRLWFAVLIFTFVIPPQITMVPTFVLYHNLGILGSLNAFLVPALLGQGFNSAIFILIFYNFHRQVPDSLIEAAEIDGAGHISSFFRISMPLAVPAIIVTLLFSFVWYWNETFLVNLFLGFGNTRDEGLTTLLLELTRFEDSYAPAITGAGMPPPDPVNEGIRMAGTMLSILPLGVLYLILQRHFVESVDKAGITGE